MYGAVCIFTEITCSHRDAEHQPSPCTICVSVCVRIFHQCILKYKFVDNNQ